MKRPYQIAGIVIFLVGAFFALESARLPYYVAQGPASGFFPFWISTMLALLGLVIFLQATFRESDPMPADFFASKAGYTRVGMILGGMVFILLAMDMLGYIITMFTFIVFMLVGMERRNPLIAVAFALAGSVGIYYGMAHVISFRLPVGLLGF